jgi:deoxyadenosine/deoxycytidine kinase
MSKLITIVGPSGVGKTSLVNALSRAADFSVAYEQHSERPFQSLFKRDSHFALANQLDYLLFRAEQERELRRSPLIALTDGGLDLDFYGFTRLFHTRGFLSGAEFDLCRRFHAWTRELLPPPDLVIALSAPDKTIRQRLASRNRINIASAEDTALFNSFLEEWLATLPKENLLRLDVGKEKLDYAKSADIILKHIQKIFTV